MKNAITWISAAHAVVALTSFLAVRGVWHIFDDIGRRYAGVGTGPELVAGIAQLARWPMIAACGGAAVSVAALLFARGAAPQERPARTALQAALAIGAGAGSVVVFRAAATFSTAAILPGTAEPLPVIATRLWVASAISAICFAAAALMAVLAFRSRAAMPVTVLAVAISAGASAAMVVTMRDLSARHHSIAHGAPMR